MSEKCQKDQKIADLSDALGREKYRADEWSRVSIAKAKQAEELAKQVSELKERCAKLGFEFSVMSDQFEASLCDRDEVIGELLAMLDSVTNAVRSAARSKANPLAGAGAVNMIEVAAVVRDRAAKIREYWEGPQEAE